MSRITPSRKGGMAGAYSLGRGWQARGPLPDIDVLLVVPGVVHEHPGSEGVWLQLSFREGELGAAGDRDSGCRRWMKQNSVWLKLFG